MWLSGSMILMYSYTGNLRASLMNPSFTRPLDTVADVYESGYTCQISNQPCFPLEERGLFCINSRLPFRLVVYRSLYYFREQALSGEAVRGEDPNLVGLLRGSESVEHQQFPADEVGHFVLFSLFF